MIRMIAFTAAVPLLLLTAPPAAANITSDQLTDQCRPQLQTFIQEELAYRPDGGSISAEKAAEDASVRANGVNDPNIRKIVDAIRTGYSTASKATMRKELVEMKSRMRGVANVRGQGPDNAISFVAQCMMEAILADMEGRPPISQKAGVTPGTDQSASAAAAAAQDEADAEAAAGTTVPPLRPTAKLEAHNPANDASQCLTLITKADFKRQGVSTTMGAAFRNSCAYPVETLWCIGDRCTTGYDNTATMPARGDRGISYDTPAGVKTETRWAGCRLGFAHRPDFKGTLHYACK